MVRDSRRSRRIDGQTDERIHAHAPKCRCDGYVSLTVSGFNENRESSLKQKKAQRKKKICRLYHVIPFMNEGFNVIPHHTLCGHRFTLANCRERERGRGGGATRAVRSCYAVSVAALLISVIEISPNSI